MNILGLDLSVRATGIAHVDGHLSTFSPQTNDDRRLVEIRNHLVAIVRSEAIELVMLEAPFVTKDNAGRMLLQAHGVVKVALMSNRVPYLYPAPQLVKMYATGKGTAPKLDVVKALMRRRPDIDPGDDNQADAWWLRAMGHALAGAPIVGLPDKHTRALDNLRLPAALREGTPR